MNMISGVELKIPAFGKTPEIALPLTSVKEGERRLVEAKMVNPATYAELEYVFGEGYREAKRNITIIGYEITQAEKALREARSIAILDEYPQFLKDKGVKDNATLRDAFLERQPAFVAAQDRIDMLKAMQDLMEGKVKVFENVCRYMRKEMDLAIRSGVINHNKYVG